MGRGAGARAGHWTLAGGSRDLGGAPGSPPTAAAFGLEPGDEPRRPGAVCAAARDLVGRQALDELWGARRTLEEKWSREAPWLTDDRLAWQLEATQKRCGRAPTAEDVLAALKDETRERFRWSGPVGTPVEVELEFELFHWEEQHCPTTAPELPDLDDWFPGPDPYLLLMPTPRGPESVAYMSSWFVYGGVAALTYDRMVALLNWWQERYGAELVANWGTMLQFVVHRPPETLDEAWDLAVDIDLIGPSSGFPHVRDHARFLWQRPTWFIHNHP